MPHTEKQTEHCTTAKRRMCTRQSFREGERLRAPDDAYPPEQLTNEHEGPKRDFRTARTENEGASAHTQSTERPLSLNCSEPRVECPCRTRQLQVRPAVGDRASERTCKRATRMTGTVAPWFGLLAAALPAAAPLPSASAAAAEVTESRADPAANASRASAGVIQVLRAANLAERGRERRCSPSPPAANRR